MTTLAFDVYGTLIDTAGVTGRLGELIGDQAKEFSDTWRTKQLEYTWRYGLMRRYRDFRICTAQALDWTCDHLDCELGEAEREGLMATYLELPAFADVADGLLALKALDVGMYAFSNGVPEDLRSLLETAGLLDFLDGIVSVHEIETFKPDPATYAHMVSRGGSTDADTWLVSSNGFDVCGARAAGLNAFWLQRNPAIRFDHWEFQPTHVVHDFTDIVRILSEE